MATKPEKPVDAAPGPVGVFPVRFHRQERKADTVAERVKDLKVAAPTCIEAADVKVKGLKGSGPKRVQALNHGFFALEQLRHQEVREKKRVRKRRKVRG